MISLLNSLRKVFKKVVVGMLAEWCAINHVFHESRMSFRKQRSIIDALEMVIFRVQKAWVKGKLASLLLIDEK